MNKTNLTEFRKYCSLLLLVLMVFAGFSFTQKALAQEGKKSLKVGLAVLKDNPDYNDARRNFVSVLEREKELTVEFVALDAYGDGEAYKEGLKKLVNDDKVNLIFTTGTRSTQPAVEIVKEIPVIFTAVYDPVGAGIVKSLEHPGGNFTGTHCAVPTEAQVKTIMRVLPDAKSIGIVYTKNEANAELQTQEFKKACESLGLKVLTSTVSLECKTADEIAEATKKLVGKVDVLVGHQDTSISRYGKGMLDVARENKIPTYVTLTQLLDIGGVFSLGIDFKALGTISGEQAVKILRDNMKPSDIPVATDKNYSLIINLAAAKEIGLKMPLKVLKSASKLMR